MRSSQKTVSKRGNWRLNRFFSAPPSSPQRLNAKAWLPSCFQRRGVLLWRNLPAPPAEKKRLTTGFLANNMRVIRHCLAKIHHLHSLVRTYPLRTVAGVFTQTAGET